MQSLRLTLLNNTAALYAASIVVAILVGVLTSSLFGFGLFLLVPSAVAWLLRR
jgi:hypothetical protein